MNMFDTIWPDVVVNHVDGIFQAISETLDPEEVSPEILRSQLSKHLLDKHLNGQEFILSEEEFTQIYMLSSIETTLQQLQEKKLVNSIENEHGELVYWLTPMGKEVANSKVGNAKNTTL